VDVGLLPVKALAAAKQRLAPDFSPAQRREIAGALLEDALEMCATTPFIDWWVVTADPGAASAARLRGLEVFADAGQGLNDSLAAAVRVAIDAGAGSVTVIPADVPLAVPDDLTDLLDTGATSDLVLVPAPRDGGTNGLHMSPPGLVEPRFGPESLQSYVQLADRLGLRCSILGLERLTLDIDTPEDVRRFLQSSPSGHTAEALRRLLPATG
jgi:2-phospho-L-lactate/phosphoenolpyruvate guanylyltransferase